MIRKLLKRLGLLLGLLVLVPVCLAVAGAILLPKDKVKGQVATFLAESTGAQVDLGHASINLWPHLAVSFVGGSISGTGQALAAATGSSTQLESFQVDLGEVKLQVKLRSLLRKQIEITSARVAGPNLRVTWDKGELLAEQFALEIINLELPLLAVQDQADPGPGEGTSGSSGPIGEGIPEDLALAFTGEAGRLTLQRVSYDEVVFLGDLEARVLTVESVQARRSTGTISGFGEIDFERNPGGELDFQARAQAVPAGSLLEPWVPDLARRLTGDLNAEVSGTCNLRDSDTALASLSLNGGLSCGEGALAAADWLGDIAPYLGNRQDLTNIRFRSLTHAFRIDEGRYQLEEFFIDGHDTDWLGSGWVGLDGTIDAFMNVKLPPGFTPELGQWSFLANTLRDDEGRVNLDLHLTGMAAAPKVALNLGRLQDGGASSATEALKKGLGGLLDKWKTR